MTTRRPRILLAMIVLAAVSTTAAVTVAAISRSSRNDTRPTPTGPIDDEAQPGRGASDPDIVVGRDGWLFFADDLDPACSDIGTWPEVDRLRDGPDRLRFIVNEPKSAFYPAQILPADRPAPCVGVARARRRQRSEADLRAIRIDDAIGAAQARGSDVFVPTDSHWSPQGRVSAAEALVEAIEPGLWDPEDVHIDDLPRLQDLGARIGIEESTTVRGPTVARGPVTVDQRENAELLGQSFVNFQRTRSGADGVIGGVTYLVGDSQMAHLLPDIEPYFEELVFINWFHVELGVRDFGGQPDPDRLIVQSIERYAISRFDDRILDDLAARLPG